MHRLPDPASLACAAELRAHGAAVTIFDKRPLPGGLNTYGVARYKLTAAESQREVDLIRNTGVEFRNGVEIGRDISVPALERSFDAIFLGVWTGRDAAARDPRGNAPRRYECARFHRGVQDRAAIIDRRRCGGHRRRQHGHGCGHCRAASGRGAGLRCSIGARKPTCPPFSSSTNMPGARAFVSSGTRGPIAFTGTRQVDTVQCHGGFEIACDTVIIAIGQLRLLELLQSTAGIELLGGLVTIDAETGQTTNPKYFAAGDCVNGGREVVDAAAGGKRAARGIVNWLTKRHA